ncbi:SRPBCC family protein [Mucilaginibacter boryungensis]|uniref:SRPBCC domain-containing protein n=1 Tax=Mucilaginibacter boryungensis TaxID=768480 RepID=A0ABR9XER5_9SPHI|nr:SRPBCC domain-containing protein [Mucilaginibacter boryungensis]MBE9665868.1 SRPBCC domain-containing protein [Mucilaginibacter boryungensis]
MERDIHIRWFLAHPPQKVWECLTDPTLLSQWLMKNDFKPIVGHKFNFHSKPIPKMGFDGTVYCEVLELVPSKKLAYSWKGGPKPGVIKLDTRVIWTLEAKNGGTELLLEQKGFKGFHNYLASIFMGSGWRNGIARRFKIVLNNYVQGIHTSENVPADC